jgi:hypothetical protein
MAKKRPIIKWTGTSGGAPPPRVEVLQLPPFRGATDPPSEDPKIYAQWLASLQKAGSMFTVTVPLYEEYLPKYYTQPAYPVLSERMTGRNSEPIAKIGTVAVFAGSIRSEERKKDATLRLLRHTFIIGTGCYIIPILACLKPVAEELHRWPRCPAAAPMSGLLGGGATKGMTTNSTRSLSASVQRKGAQMGLAQGGRMEQKISADPHGIDTWDQAKAERIFIHIVDATLWREITGEECPPSPISASEYKGAWFTYDNGKPAVQGSGTLANVKPVSQKDKDHGFEGQQDDSPLNEKKTNPVVALGVKVPKNVVTDGKW